MMRFIGVFGTVVAMFATSCESRPPVEESAQDSLKQPVGGPAWTFVGEPDLKLQGGTARLIRGRVETVITLLGGTTVVTLRKRGEPTILWTQEDRAVIEIAMPGRHCFVSSDGESETQEHAFAVQFSGPELNDGTFHGEMPCTTGPDLLKFSGSFKVTP